MAARSEVRGWRPSRADVAVAAAAAVLAISSAAIVGANADEPDFTLVGALVLLAECVPLAVRRRRPVHVWAVVGAASVVYGMADWPDPIVPVAAFISLAAVVEHCSRRTSIVVWCISAAAALIGLVLPGDSDALDAWMVVTLLVVAPLLGDQQRARRAHVAELEAGVERAARDRDRELRTTRLTERAHLARELHDVVAHHVSMIVVQAEAAAAAASTADGSASTMVPAFDAIGSSARRTLAELRTLLDVLHTDERQAAPTAPQPGVDQIGDLVHGVPDDVMTIDLVVEGARRALPPAVDLSAYRVVQEGITNVIKHAGARHASVRISYEPERLAVTVTDDGSGRDAPAQPGRGLDGLRERVALLDGTLSAAPGPEGGFELSVSLPAPVVTQPAPA